MMVRRLLLAVLALMVLSAPVFAEGCPTHAPCSGCGCAGGPGYRGPDGKQYVVIASTGGGFFNNPVTDDSITAFALDVSSGKRPKRGAKRR